MFTFSADILSLQGAGTAIGELPPYFMARAARLSGAGLEDDDFEEIEELIHEKKEHPEELVGLIPDNLGQKSYNNIRWSFFLS